MYMHKVGCKDKIIETVFSGTINVQVWSCFVIFCTSHKCLIRWAQTLLQAIGIANEFLIM